MYILTNINVYIYIYTHIYTYTHIDNDIVYCIVLFFFSLLVNN